MKLLLLTMATFYLLSFVNCCDLSADSKRKNRAGRPATASTTSSPGPPPARVPRKVNIVGYVLCIDRRASKLRCQATNCPGSWRQYGTATFDSITTCNAALNALKTEPLNAGSAEDTSEESDEEVEETVVAEEKEKGAQDTNFYKCFSGHYSCIFPNTFCGSALGGSLIADEVYSSFQQCCTDNAYRAPSDYGTYVQCEDWYYGEQQENKWE